MRFVSGAEEEPVLGFALKPSITFVEAQTEKDFIPTASTCTNKLFIRRGSPQIDLPSEKELFNYYDYAFSNEFFGVM